MSQPSGFFGSTFGALGLNLLATASPLMAMQRLGSASTKTQSFREPDKEALAMNFPGSGIQKVAIPYNERKGKIKFPNNKQVAVHVYVAIEYAVQKPVTAKGAVSKWDISALSASSEYNYHIASFRALDMLEKVGIKSTALVNAWPAEPGWPRERYAQIYKEFHSAGHEIMVHNYSEDETQAVYTPEEEVVIMRKARNLLGEVTGELPVGYITQGDTDRTISFQIDEGYLYTASLRDDDNPWIYKKGDKMIVEVPHRTPTTGDWSAMGHPNLQFVHQGWQRTPQQSVDYCKKYLEAYIQTAEEQGWPLGLTFGIHPYVGCLPDRARILERMLTHMSGHPKVWMCTYKELATHWKQNYA
jgi:hypothetical protein